VQFILLKLTELSYAFILQSLLASSYSLGNYEQARLIIYRVIQVNDCYPHNLLPFFIRLGHKLIHNSFLLLLSSTFLTDWFRSWSHFVDDLIFWVWTIF